MSVEATSAYLKGKNASAAVTNLDTAVTTSPIYAITKSAVTNLGSNRFDLNNTDAYVDYTIVIKNEGNADGTAVTIEDKLPEGLMAIRSNEANYKAPTTIASNGSAAVTSIISANGELVSVIGQNIKKDETITITFRAKKSAIASNNSNFVNYAVVKEDTNGDGVFDLVDSSGDKSDTRVTENNYENPNFPNIGKDDNTKAEIVATTQSRKLTISPGVNKEVALQSTTFYSYTITNAGTDLREGFNKGDVAISVAAIANNPNITIDRVFVDANNDGVFNAGETVLTADPSGEYDLNDAVPGGLEANKSVNIGVEVIANGSGSKLNKKSDIGGTETMTITVTPKKTILGTPAPSSVSTTSITTMQGIDLTKYQTIATCGTDPVSIASTDWKTASIGDAAAGSCVFYKIDATNTFSSTEITDVVVKDTLDKKIIYQNNFASKTDKNSGIATNNSTDGVIQGIFAKLLGTETGSIYFSGKLSQAGIK